MGACMEHYCRGCGFEFPNSASLFDHEGVCTLVMRDKIDRLEEEVEKWKRVAVWAVKHGQVEYTGQDDVGWAEIAYHTETSFKAARVEPDTDEGLLAALARVAGEALE